MNVGSDYQFKDTYLSSLVSKSTSFALLGVRCNSEESTGKRKLTPGVIYPFLQEYCIEEGNVEVSAEQIIANTLYDDFFGEGFRGIPHLQVSAIVGQNGSGKSSIVEFLMRLINNFAASTVGEMKNYGNASDRLHFIDGVDGDFWYILERKCYRMTNKNANVKLFRYTQLRQEEDGRKIYYEPTLIFDNGLTESCQLLEHPLTSFGDEELKNLYENFFYTFISNQSFYAYNTYDFHTECNSDQKERLCSGCDTEQTFDLEEKCWLHGLFHKNDAYKTPLVISPFRHKGNMDINKEKELAIERLVKLFAIHEEMRTINNHLLAESLTLQYDNEKEYALSRIKKRLNYSQLNDVGFRSLRNVIVNGWSEKIGRNLSQYSNKPFYSEAIDYLVYKTLKVSYQYKEHRDFYDASSTMVDVFNADTLLALIDELAQDHSHITRKIYRTIAYLVYDVFNLIGERQEDILDRNGSYTIYYDKMFTKWYNATKIPDEWAKSSFWVNLRIQAIVPPPFFKMKINLCEKDAPSVKIDFETLSSGEKQQIFAISSILYHLDNLNSAHEDKSNPHRVAYRNVCIILEEIELYYHPQLQQEFLYYFLNSLRQVQLDYISGIHLVIVTHSPYVLSDVPRQNVLALKKDATEPILVLRSFAANVHEMLKDSFFLEGGAMGLFAQWEVGHIMACLKVHQWAQETEDTNKCPFVNHGDEFEFLNRYTYPNHEKAERLFCYKCFCNDLSSDIIMNRILLIDEPVVSQILLEEFSRTFPNDPNKIKELKRAELRRQLQELDGE